MDTYHRTHELCNGSKMAWGKTPFPFIIGHAFLGKWRKCVRDPSPKCVPVTFARICNHVNVIKDDLG